MGIINTAFMKKGLALKKTQAKHGAQPINNGRRDPAAVTR